MSAQPVPQQPSLIRVSEAREVIVRQVKKLSALFAGFRERMAVAGVEKDGG